MLFNYFTTPNYGSFHFNSLSTFKRIPHFIINRNLFFFSFLICSNNIIYFIFIRYSLVIVKRNISPIWAFICCLCFYIAFINPFINFIMIFCLLNWLISVNGFFIVLCFIICFIYWSLLYNFFKVTITKVSIPCYIIFIS